MKMPNKKNVIIYDESHKKDALNKTRYVSLLNNDSTNVDFGKTPTNDTINMVMISEEKYKIIKNK